MFDQISQDGDDMIEPAEIYNELRSQLLSTNPNEVGIQQSPDIPNVWGVLLEFQISNTPVTLVSLADGTTSLYFGNGGGVFGGGEHEEVAQASKKLVALAEDFYDKMTPTAEFPIPMAGRMIFYVLTFDKSYTINVDEEELTSGKHDFSPLFALADEVISQIRVHTPKE